MSALLEFRGLIKRKELFNMKEKELVVFYNEFNGVYGCCLLLIPEGGGV